VNLAGAVVRIVVAVHGPISGFPGGVMMRRDVAAVANAARTCSEDDGGNHRSLEQEKCNEAATSPERAIHAESGTWFGPAGHANMIRQKQANAAVALTCEDGQSRLGPWHTST